MNCRPHVPCTTFKCHYRTVLCTYYCALRAIARTFPVKGRTARGFALATGAPPPPRVPSHRYSPLILLRSPTLLRILHAAALRLALTLHLPRSSKMAWRAARLALRPVNDLIRSVRSIGLEIHALHRTTPRADPAQQVPEPIIKFYPDVAAERIAAAQAAWTAWSTEHAASKSTSPSRS